jgi:hypothetical protein
MKHLQFDWSEGDDGVVTLDALASSRDLRVQADAAAEAQTLLAWLEAEYPAQRGPAEEGGRWDAELSSQAEGGGWVSLALTISAAPEIAEALRARLGLD